MNKATLLALGFTTSLFACATTPDDPTDDNPGEDAQSIAVDNATHATKRIVPTIQAAAQAPAVSQNGINYHGGSVMTSTHNGFYFIWYGNWAGNTAQQIITTWGNSIGGSPWFNINSTYTDRNSLAITNRVKLLAQVSDNYSHGKNLTDNDIQAIVQDHITNGDLPVNSNALYFVITSADVMETSGFCTQYCGWHYFGTFTGTPDGKRLKFSFIGNVDQCPTACSIQQTSPNNNVGADGMISVMSHELAETVSDPYVSAWFDTSDGMENADKCAWTFGTESTASNGSKYNVTMGGLNFLIQQNWINAAGGSCGMSF